MGPITQPCDGYYPHHSSCDYLSSSLARTSFSGNALLAKKHSATQCFTHLHSEHICWQGVTDMCVCVCVLHLKPRADRQSKIDLFIKKKKKRETVDCLRSYQRRLFHLSTWCTTWEKQTGRAEWTTVVWQQGLMGCKVEMFVYSPNNAAVGVDISALVV